MKNSSRVTKAKVHKEFSRWDTKKESRMPFMTSLVDEYIASDGKFNTMSFIKDIGNDSSLLFVRVIASIEEYLEHDKDFTVHVKIIGLLCSSDALNYSSICIPILLRTLCCHRKHMSGMVTSLTVLKSLSSIIIIKKTLLALHGGSYICCFMNNMQTEEVFAIGCSCLYDLVRYSHDAELIQDVRWFIAHFMSSNDTCSMITAFKLCTLVAKLFDHEGSWEKNITRLVVHKFLFHQKAASTNSQIRFAIHEFLTDIIRQDVNRMKIQCITDCVELGSVISADVTSTLHVLVGVMYLCHKYYTKSCSDSQVTFESFGIYNMLSSLNRQANLCDCCQEKNANIGMVETLYNHEVEDRFVASRRILDVAATDALPLHGFTVDKIPLVHVLEVEVCCTILKLLFERPDDSEIMSEALRAAGAHLVLINYLLSIIVQSCGHAAYEDEIFSSGETPECKEVDQSSKFISSWLFGVDVNAISASGWKWGLRIAHVLQDRLLIKNEILSVTREKEAAAKQRYESGSHVDATVHFSEKEFGSLPKKLEIVTTCAIFEAVMCTLQLWMDYDGTLRLMFQSLLSEASRAAVNKSTRSHAESFVAKLFDVPDTEVDDTTQVPLFNIFHSLFLQHKNYVMGSAGGEDDFSIVSKMNVMVDSKLDRTTYPSMVSDLCPDCLKLSVGNSTTSTITTEVSEEHRHSMNADKDAVALVQEGDKASLAFESPQKERMTKWRDSKKKTETLVHGSETSTFGSGDFASVALDDNSYFAGSTVIGFGESCFSSVVSSLNNDEKPGLTMVTKANDKRRNCNVSSIVEVDSITGQEKEKMNMQNAISTIEYIDKVPIPRFKGNREDPITYSHSDKQQDICEKLFSKSPPPKDPFKLRGSYRSPLASKRALQPSVLSEEKCNSKYLSLHDSDGDELNSAMSDISFTSYHFPEPKVPLLSKRTPAEGAMSLTGQHIDINKKNKGKQMDWPMVASLAPPENDCQNDGETTGNTRDSPDTVGGLLGDLRDDVNSFSASGESDSIGMLLHRLPPPLDTPPLKPDALIGMHANNRKGIPSWHTPPPDMVTKVLPSVPSDARVIVVNGRRRKSPPKSRQPIGGILFKDVNQELTTYNKCPVNVASKYATAMAIAQHSLSPQYYHDVSSGGDIVSLDCHHSVAIETPLLRIDPKWIDKSSDNPLQVGTSSSRSTDTNVV